MNLTNETYLIKIMSERSTEFYYKDKDGWCKVSMQGRRFKATPEQILNHVLPALAGVKPNVTIAVEHYDDPKKRALPDIVG
jgi:hypothetical protein